MNPVLSIVVPCYNEAGNIPLIMAKFEELLAKQPQTEILLVNNGSKDNSKDVFEKELARVNDPRYKVVNVEVNQGYGFGILSGLKHATADVMAWTHADMQTDPLDILEAYKVYKANPKLLLVKGKRLGRPLLDAFFTYGMQVLAGRLLGQPLDDINAQPKLFGREFYLQYLTSNPPYDFSLDLYVLYHASRQGAVATVPVHFGKRKFGEAKGGGSLKTKWKLVKRTWAYMNELSVKLKSEK